MNLASHSFATLDSNVTLLLPQAYYILAVEYNRSGESGLGQTAFRNALSINKNSNLWLPGAMKTLGDFYRESRLFKESLAAYQEAIELKPMDSNIYLGPVSYTHLTLPTKA